MKAELREELLDGVDVSEEELETIDDWFRDKVESGIGCVVIMAGSDSDADHIDVLAKELEAYEIPYEVRIGSIHKQSGLVEDSVQHYEEMEGLLTYLTVAGGVDALSGGTSFQGNHPTVSCPPQKDVNLTCVTNPPGSSNAYVRRAKDAVRHIAQMYSTMNPKCKEVLEADRADKLEKLEEGDVVLRTHYARRQMEGGS